jgi:hypothetical protein
MDDLLVSRSRERALAVYCDRLRYLFEREVFLRNTYGLSEVRLILSLMGQHWSVA